MFKTVITSLFALVFLTFPAKAHGISDREAAAIALGTAAILGGIAIASQRRNKPRVHNHYYYPDHYPRYHTYPEPLRYRYQEPRYYRPRDFYYDYRY